MDNSSEAHERFMLLRELKDAMRLSNGFVLWIHFTDENIYMFDLLRLIDAGLLVDVFDLHYEPDGTWQDHFPPRPYALTPKARMILDNPGLWVREGKWESEQSPRS